MKKEIACVLVCVYQFFCFWGMAQKQINPSFSMPDVNIVPDGNRVYAFCGTDEYPFDINRNSFDMPYWRCFSSTDLIHWTYESMLDPAKTYMGASDKCFAGHGVKKNDQWYWYFSNHIKNTGVATSKTPRGPWKDALGEPLLPDDISPTHEYDGCVFTEPHNGQSYIVYGSHRDGKIDYHLAALADNMIKLKEKPKKIEVLGIPEGKQYLAVDAPFLHKENGLYYLSWRKPYAVSKNIYGPYTFMGMQDAHGHLGFFNFNNQNYVNYTSLKEGYRIRYRFASIAYVNYNDDGSIAPIDSVIYQYGVGKYLATWPKIEAEWYFKMPNGPIKKQHPTSGFVVQNLRHEDYLVYPNIHEWPKNAQLLLHYSSACPAGGNVEIHAYSPTGPLLASQTFASTGSWSSYQTLAIPLEQLPEGTVSLAIVVKGDAKTELIRLDWFSIGHPE